MFDDLPLFLVRLGLGFVLGVALGFVARRGRFCTLGAIEDAVYANDTRRLRSWILAIGVAIIGVHALELWGGLDLTRSIYLGARLEWGALIIGGFLFGIGMALNGTCGFGTLAPARRRRPQSADQLPGHRRRRDDDHARADRHRTHLIDRSALAAIAAILLAAPAGNGGPARNGRIVAGDCDRRCDRRFAFSHRGFRTTFRFAATGAAIGALIALGWWATGIAGFDAFDTRRIESFTFVGPLGETLYYAMLSTALQPDFPVGAVIGVVFGAFIGAKTDGSFKWEAPADANDLKRRLVGAS